MVIQLKVKGINRLTKFLVKLPTSMNKEIIGKSNAFMKFVRKSAKLRAPRMTGRLAESIMIKRKKNEIILTVDSPYGVFQEMGFAPHWIHSNMSDRMGGTVGGLFNKFDSFFFVSRHKPFIAPALEAGLSKLPNMLSQGTKKAIKQARR